MKLSKGRTLYLSKEIAAKLGVPEGKAARLAIYAADDGVLLKVVEVLDE